MVKRMLEKAAIALTEFMYKKNAISLSKRSVFIYGFQLALSTFCSLLSVLFLSIIMGRLLSALMFFIVFFWIRLFSGGFHASSYLKCFILTNAIYLQTVLISEIFIWTSSLLPALLIQIVSGAVVFLLSPIRHKNHPLSETIYIRNQKIARWLVVIFEHLFPCIAFLTNNLAWMALCSASLMAVAILMIIPKIQERRNQYE